MAKLDDAIDNVKARLDAFLEEVRVQGTALADQAQARLDELSTSIDELQAAREAKK